MRFRTLAVALALACGLTAMAEASPAKQKAVVHRTARQGTVRKSGKIKAHRVKSQKTVKTATRAKSRRKTGA
jgi:hypothetical protein